MKIYSNTLTQNDLYAALPMGVHIADIEIISKPRTKNPVTGLSYARGWNIYLEGSSVHRSQHDDGVCGRGQAATWDEWGIWMAELYRLDPEARIAWYKTYEDFILHTTRARNHYANQNSRDAKMHRAPWFDKSEKLGEGGTVRIMAPSGW